MTSNSGHPPLLILTNSIYAKRKDGTFHPGSIEDKDIDTYTVKFNDGARERIVEGDLTWLGFWGMPPWSWPTAPLIQPAMSWKAFEERPVFGREESEFQGFRPSFNEQRRDDTLLERPESNEASQTDDYNSLPCSKEQDSSHIPRASSPTDHSTTRSSVLRFNPNILSKEANFEDSSRASTSAKSKRTSSAGTSPPSQTAGKRNREKRGDFESIFTSATTDVEATRTTNTNEEHQRNVEKEWTSEIDKEMTDYSQKRRRHSFPEVTTHEEERRLANDDMKYFKRNLLNTHQSDGGPFTMSSSHVIAPQVPFFGQPFGMAIFGTSPHDAIPYSFQIQPKTRKRGEKKKCRKVYGIENRHFWCTQCRWKKACTRFATSNRIISSEFV